MLRCFSSAALARCAGRLWIRDISRIGREGGVARSGHLLFQYRIWWVNKPLASWRPHSHRPRYAGHEGAGSNCYFAGDCRSTIACNSDIWLGPIPGFGMVGAAIAMLVCYSLGVVGLIAHLQSSRSTIHLTAAGLVEIVLSHSQSCCALVGAGRSHQRYADCDNGLCCALRR